MYRYFTFRLRDVPLPVTRYTREHREVRVVAYNAGRDGDTPLPAENIYVVRAPQRLHDEIVALFDTNFDLKRRIPSPEPGVLVLHARFHFPAKGPMTGFLAVLTEAVGTILEFRPLIIEDGHLEVSLISLPRNDSLLRIRAIQQYADEKGIGFDLVENRPLPQLPLKTPRQTILDLLEWQVVQALHASGLYDLDAPDADDPGYARVVIADLAEALGLEPEEVDEIRRTAARRILSEFITTRAENIRLATPPRRAEDERADDAEEEE